MKRIAFAIALVLSGMCYSGSVAVADEGQDDGFDDAIGDRSWGPLSDLTREQLEEEGFVFEDTVAQQARAHATLFASTAGVVVPGAGHWHMDDSRTALALLATDATALTLLVTGLALRMRPQDSTLRERRRELWFLGTGLLGSTWMIDLFGTAYSDDLGIPTSTRREAGLGVGMRYEYLRPTEFSMRHVATTELFVRSRNLEAELRTSQELGWGMSDYELGARWYPFVGTRAGTRLGIGATGRQHHYRLDVPYQRADLRGMIHGSLDLGQLFAHLNQMTVGVSAGIGIRGYRLVDDDGLWTPLGYSGSTFPMRLFLALNLTEQLRFRTAYERGIGGWVELSPARVGIPSAELMYRSTDRIDLRFRFEYGNGMGVGAGLRFWFGE